MGWKAHTGFNDFGFEELQSVQVGDLEFGAVALNLAPYSNKRQMTEEHVFNHSKSLVRVVENPHEI